MSYLRQGSPPQVSWKEANKKWIKKSLLYIHLYLTSHNSFGIGASWYWWTVANDSNAVDIRQTFFYDKKLTTIFFFVLHKTQFGQWNSLHHSLATRMNSEKKKNLLFIHPNHHPSLCLQKASSFYSWFHLVLSSCVSFLFWLIKNLPHYSLNDHLDLNLDPFLPFVLMPMVMC